MSSLSFFSKSKGRGAVDWAELKSEEEDEDYRLQFFRLACSNSSKVPSTVEKNVFRLVKRLRSSKSKREKIDIRKMIYTQEILARTIALKSSNSSWSLWGSSLKSLIRELLEVDDVNKYDLHKISCSLASGKQTIEKPRYYRQEEKHFELHPAKQTKFRIKDLNDEVFNFWGLHFHDRSAVSYKVFAQCLSEYLFAVYKTQFIPSVEMEKLMQRLTNPNVLDPRNKENVTYPEKLNVRRYLKMMLAFGPFEHFLKKALPCVTRNYECTDWWVGLVNDEEIRQCKSGDRSFFIRYGNPLASLVHQVGEQKTAIENKPNNADYFLLGKRDSGDYEQLHPTDVVDALFRGWKENLKTSDYFDWQKHLKQEVNEADRARYSAQIINWYIPSMNAKMENEARGIVSDYGYVTLPPEGDPQKDLQKHHFVLEIPEKGKEILQNIVKMKQIYVDAQQQKQWMTCAQIQNDNLREWRTFFFYLKEQFRGDLDEILSLERQRDASRKLNDDITVFEIETKLAEKKGTSKYQATRLAEKAVEYLEDMCDCRKRQRAAIDEAVASLKDRNESRRHICQDILMTSATLSQKIIQSKANFEDTEKNILEIFGTILAPERI